MMKRAGNERLGNHELIIPLAAATRITEGSMVAINEEGYAVPAAKAENLVTAGVAQVYADNLTGAAGDKYVQVRRGQFVMNNDGTIKETDILRTCYLTDATTVTITPTGSSKAGVILGLEEDSVIVEF